MKKLFWALLLFQLAFTASAYADKKPSASESKQREAHAKKLDDRKKELNDTEWDITVGVPGKPNAQTEQDKLIFKDGTITTENLEKQGFAPTNYTVTVSDDLQSATFETMKSGKDGIVFIRGDWTKDTMQGNISEQLDGGKKTLDYYFTSKPKKQLAPTEKEASAEKVSGAASEDSGPKVMTSGEKSAKNSGGKKGGALVSMEDSSG